MARKVITQLVDDVDGTTLEAGEGETVLFGLDGVSYEIDLSDANAAVLRDGLQPYVTAARKTGSARARAARGVGKPASRDLSGIREWALSNGLEVSSRGRIPQSIIEAYDNAH